jgi:hypothetical protein
MSTPTSQPQKPSPFWQSVDNFLDGFTTQQVVIMVICTIILFVCVIRRHQATTNDIPDAEAVVGQAWTRVKDIEKQAQSAFETYREFKEWSEDTRRQRLAGRNEDRPWVYWMETATETRQQKSDREFQRRSDLLELAADYRKLISLAERELIAAKTAAAAGSPVRIANRIRSILKPILQPE